MLAITRQRQSTSSMLWAWTRSSRRSRPATAGLCHPRPEVAYPAICLPGTGCDGSYRAGGVGSATLCGCKTVEPVFGQIKQGRGFRQFLLRGLEKVNGEWSLICTGHNLLKTVPLWGQSAQEGTGRWASPTHQETLPR